MSTATSVEGSATCTNGCRPSTAKDHTIMMEKHTTDVHTVSSIGSSAVMVSLADKRTFCSCTLVA